MRKITPAKKEEKVGITLRVAKSTLEVMKKEAESCNMNVSEYLIALHRMYMEEQNKK